MNNVRKTIRLILALALVFCLAASALAEGKTVGLANPWVETTEEELMNAIGVRFGVPEEAEDVVYRMLEEEKLAEMQFSWEGVSYVARIKPVAEMEDISGLYYDEWDTEMECKIGWCEGTIRRMFMGEETIDLCLWYDFAPGLMYSLAATAEDLDGFDIQAAAEIVYLPAQDDADGEEANEEAAE